MDTRQMSEVSTLPPDLAAARLMARARQVTARLPRLAGQNADGLAAALVAVRGAIAELWPQVPPEVACEAILVATSAASQNGVTTVPFVPGMPAGELADADKMLELAAEWFSVGRYPAADEPRGSLGQAAEPRAFATALAFDRNYDQETFVTLVVLLTLAGLAIPLPTRRGGLWLE